MYNITYLPLANDDILAAVNYVAERLENPMAAEELLNELDQTVDRLARFPYAHELYHTNRPMQKEIRKVAVKGYVLYYSVDGNAVEIQRFIHGRKDREHLCEFMN